MQVMDGRLGYISSAFLVFAWSGVLLFDTNISHSYRAVFYCVCGVVLAISGLNWLRFSSIVGLSFAIVVAAVMLFGSLIIISAVGLSQKEYYIALGIVSILALLYVVIPFISLGKRRLKPRMSFPVVGLRTLLRPGLTLGLAALLFLTMHLLNVERDYRSVLLEYVLFGIATVFIITIVTRIIGLRKTST